MIIKAGIIDTGKAKIPLNKMGRTHLINMIGSLSRDQLTEYSPKRQNILDILLEELNRRIAKEKLQDLF